ncbi:hypothetical protein JT358_12825 [Micrococcales bacterium 31B]|nr:hypothetical protein [Micrococcales bacterium 31B]
MSVIPSSPRARNALGFAVAGVILSLGMPFIVGTLVAPWLGSGMALHPDLTGWHALHMLWILPVVFILTSASGVLIRWAVHSRTRRHAPDALVYPVAVLIDVAVLTVIYHEILLATLHGALLAATLSVLALVPALLLRDEVPGAATSAA